LTCCAVVHPAANRARMRAKVKRSGRSDLSIRYSPVQIRVSRG
jgi:hypothetical protein